MEKIIVKLNEGKIVVKFGEQGLKGAAGTTDHAALTNLDYDNAEHTNFQKKLNYISEFKAYTI